MTADQTAGQPPAASRRRRSPAALQHPGFRRLTTAWVFTNIADSALYLMLAVWIKDLTGSDSAAALTFAMLGLPALLAPFLGQIADRYSRKRLLVIANLLVAGVVTTLLLVDSADQIVWIYAVVLVYASVAYLSASAQTGLVRDLLPDEQLASGNGLLSTIDQALRLLSPLVGTALYAVWGPHAVILLTSVAFVIAAGLLATMKVTESEPETAEQRGSYWTELTAGFRHLAGVLVLGRLTIVVAIAFGATGLVNVAIFPAIEQGLGLPSEALGPLVSVQGVGAVVGGLTAATLIGRSGEARVFGIGVLLLALAMLPLAGTSLALVIAALAVGGFGISWSIVSFITLRQRLTPPRLQGRTGSATAIAINLPQTLVTLVGAALLGIVDYRLLVIATGVIVVLSLVLLPRRAGADASAAPEVTTPHTVDG